MSTRIRHASKIDHAARTNSVRNLLGRSRDSLQERFETTAHNEGRRPVLVLDESHELSPDVLGMLCILTNFDMDSRLVLSLVIAGQTPLRSPHPA
jgi:type II secretory pathway predicted ATPase ExeA